MAGLDKEYVGEAWSAENARVGYFAQEPQLDSSKTVLENVMVACRPILTEMAREIQRHWGY
jgi:sulfate-transporting ATPase